MTGGAVALGRLRRPRDVAAAAWVAAWAAAAAAAAAEGGTLADRPLLVLSLKNKK